MLDASDDLTVSTIGERDGCRAEPVKSRRDGPEGIFPVHSAGPAQLGNGMGKERLNAFTDGVIAVIITIMVLELKAPHDESWHGLLQQWPIFVSYVVSFTYVAIYWNNHHHLMQLVHHINGKVMWANMHLLFWLSLFPFVTSWVAESDFAPVPVVLYGTVLLMASIAWPILMVQLIVCNGGREGHLGQATGADVKGKLSMAAYFI